MPELSARGRRSVRARLASALSLVLGVVVLAAVPSPAQALSSGVAFSAEAMSSWQIDGFARAVTSVAGRVVVGGSFKRLLPPTGSSGTAITTTPNLAVLDADTGQPTSCRLPVAQTNGSAVVWALTPAPSGNIVYVGGEFTSIGGVAVQRLAAVDVVRCTVTSLRAPTISSTVFGLAATSSTLFFTGQFVSVGTSERRGFAAISTTSGALRTFGPTVNYPGRALALSPDQTRLAIGGDFTEVNGVASHSLAVVDATTGDVVKAYGPNFVQGPSNVKAIVSDGTSFYTGSEGTGTGIFDGRIALDWSTLNERWRDGCLGATQALAVYKGILYSGSHAHDCTAIGGYPNGQRRYFLAEGTADRKLRGWFPLSTDGVNEGVGPRGLAVVTGASGRTYLYAVGEFTEINHVKQQGITRFGSSDTNAPPAPVVQAETMIGGTVQVRIWTTVDSDDDTLTYRLYRDGASTPIWTGKATSFWWTRPQITLTDKNVTAGKAYAYTVTASDGTNTSAVSAPAKATAQAKGAAYPTRVIADGAQLYWRYDEPAGSYYTWDKGVDSIASPLGYLARNRSLNPVPGAIAGDTAASFDGTYDFVSSDLLHTAPTVYSVETWFKTTTNVGGSIIGFSDARAQTDTGEQQQARNVDRQLYMEDSGRLDFGTYNGSIALVRSARAYNDGQWHHVVASQNADGMALYVDGARIGRNTRADADSYAGVWTVGSAQLYGWTNAPSSKSFAGSIDETAVYEGKTLSAQDVVDHYALSGRGTTVRLNPTADTTVAENNPDHSYGTYNQLFTRAPGSGAELQSYLRFDASAIPAGATIDSASLSVTTSLDPTAASTGASEVRLLTGSWSEADTVWSNRPTGIGAVAGRLDSAPELGTEYTVPLDLSALSLDDTGSLSLALVGTTADNLRIDSRDGDDPDAGPHLDVTYHFAP